MKTVIIQNGAVHDILEPLAGLSISECFPASLLADAIEAPDEVQIGWLSLDGGKTYSAPSAPPQAAPTTQHDFLGFLNLFTEAEQAAIVSSDNGQIRLFCLMAAGANFVDLVDPRTVAGTNELEKLGLIGKGRAAQVLVGQAVSAA
jgi:hypothetical protein